MKTTRISAILFVSSVLLPVFCGQVLAALDFGDAPAPYPTLAASGGANHVINPAIYLGAQIDSEPDGQPFDSTATGDDNAGTDDEDGVVFTSLMIPNYSAQVDITASVPGFLTAWIDFTGNLTWADGGDQIFFNMPLTAGVNKLSFNVPVWATPNSDTFARFRFSTVGMASYLGQVSNGEVEDYMVHISEPVAAVDIGTAFTYQGGLNDAGEPANGLYDFEFALYIDPSATLSAQVGSTVTIEDANVVDGSFAVKVDFGPDIFTGDAHWLEIAVRPGASSDPCDFETLSPRQELTPTPYALHIRWFLVDTALGNVFAGEDAGASNTTGLRNSAVGSGALYGNTTGVSNSAMGSGALYLNTTGRNNSAMGTYALLFNTIGNSNSVVGAYALFSNATGNSNSALGKDALFSNTTGNSNSAMGDGANYYNQEGSRNTIIGYEAGKGPAAHNKSGNVFIGYKAGYNEIGDNKLYIANSDVNPPLIYGEFDTGKIGIGTTTPTTKLDVVGTVSATAFVGDGSGLTGIAGGDSDWTISGSDMYSSVAGNVGIGTTNPLSKLSVGGNGIADTGVYGSGSWVGVYGRDSDSSSNGRLGYDDIGVFGHGVGSSGYGVSGYASGIAGRGVYGLADNNGNVTNYGGYFHASGDTGLGVYGLSTGSDGYGVKGVGQVGVHGESPFNNGIGVSGKSWSNGGYGVKAINSASYGTGLYATGGTNGYAAEFDGDVLIRTGGRLITPVLEITGADLAEQFPFSEPVEPGMVVAIDHNNAGKLSLARGAYNRRVAGIVAGANDFSTGLVLGKDGEDDTLKLLVALTGRVYCWADTSNGSIEPGDLLTTSNVPGHAMQVIDYAKAQGAILGKAMSSLESGKGLVLVLVSLQ